MKFFVTVFFLVFISSFVVTIKAQRGIQWSKRGDAYYVTEENAVVEYSLPFFQRKILVDSSKLIPKGGVNALRIHSFSFDEKGDKILIFTNTKKVWRFH